MLLKSTSTPILKSWIHQPTLGMDLSIPFKTSRSISLSLSSPPSPPPRSSSLSSSSPISSSTKKILRTLSENDLKEVLNSKTKLFSTGFSHDVVENPEKEDEEENMGLETSLEKLLSTSGLDESRVVGVNEDCADVLGCHGGGSCGGGLCGGGGDDGGGNGGGGGDEGSENWDWWDHGNESMDGYYQKMIKADPGNALLLGNYARYLKEVHTKYLCRDKEKLWRFFLFLKTCFRKQGKLFFN